MNKLAVTFEKRSGSINEELQVTSPTLGHITLDVRSLQFTRVTTTTLTSTMIYNSYNFIFT